MRRRRSSLFSVLFVVVIAGAYIVLALLGKVPSPIEGLKKTLAGESTMSQEEIYRELSADISSPDRKTSLDGKFTITVYVADEAEEIIFDEEPDVKHLLQPACIARNDDYFYLDVKDLAKPLEEDKYYKVTGTLAGTVYWTEDSKKVTALHVLANKAEPFTPDEDKKVNNGPSYTDGTSEFTFLGAHYSEGLTGQLVVVYFDYKNNGTSDASPSMHSLKFYQGDAAENSSTSIYDPKEVDTGALNATKAGIPDKTYAGKTQRYFAVYSVNKDVEEDKDTMWLVRFSDDYELTDEIGIPIEKNLKALQK